MKVFIRVFLFIVMLFSMPKVYGQNVINKILDDLKKQPDFEKNVEEGRRDMEELSPYVKIIYDDEIKQGKWDVEGTKALIGYVGKISQIIDRKASETKNKEEAEKGKERAKKRVKDWENSVIQIANDAFNYQVCELYYDKPGTPLLPTLKVEIEEQDACADSLKRMMCLFFKIYPKYFSKGVDSDVSYLMGLDIGEGLYVKLRSNCHGDDYWAAMSDLYPVQWYSYMQFESSDIGMHLFLHLKDIYGDKLGLHYYEYEFRSDKNVPERYRKRDLEKN